jgi:type II secretory pathway pseudopilin PulG
MNQPQAPKTPGIAIAALVLSALFCVPFAPLIGLILGIVALTQISRSNGQLGGNGIAIAAVIIGGFMVFANIGMLAAIAIPNFIRYQARAKQAEIKVNLGSLRAGAQAYAADKTRFPAGSTGWVPEGPCNRDGCKGDASALSQPPWSDLGMSPESTRRYQYRYASTDPKNQTFEIEAQGDIDGDGNYDKWKLSGRINESGNVEIDPPVEETPGQF